MLILEILTIGLPFCAFKILSGLYWRQYWLTGLGFIDLIINASNLIGLIFLRKRVMDACLLSLLTRKIMASPESQKNRWQDLGNSLDVFVSFSIVALMIGGNFLKDLSSVDMNIWNVSVILNVFGAGYSRVLTSVRNLKN